MKYDQGEDDAFSGLGARERTRTRQLPLRLSFCLTRNGLPAGLSALCSVFHLALCFLVALVRHCHCSWSLPGRGEPDGLTIEPLTVHTPAALQATPLTVNLAGPIAMSWVGVTLRTCTVAVLSLPCASTALTSISWTPRPRSLAPCQSSPTALPLARPAEKFWMVLSSAAKVMRRGPPGSVAEAWICSGPA